MTTYKPEKGVDIYPFISSIPFPSGCIIDIKLALKSTNQTPYVTAVASKQNYFSIQLQTDHVYIGNFLYTDNKWITLNNQHVFGFVLLGTIPVNTFYFTGKWSLQRSCYTFPVELDGLKKASFSGLSLEPSDILNLAISGDLSLRQRSDSQASNSTSDSAFQVVNIGRDQAAHEQYTESGNQPTTFVKTINGISADELVLETSDSTIDILSVQEKNDQTSVIYIKTKESFPACPQWTIKQSDSEQVDIS